MENRQKFPLLFVSLLLGAAIGLFYGWVLRPIRPASCQPGNFRSEYRTDFVLMVAESYAGELDTGLALQRLDMLEGAAPGSSLRDALTYARSHEYPQEDIEILERLLSALASQGAAPQPAPGDTP